MMMAFVDAAEAPARHTNQIKLHGPEAFEGMRKAGRLAAECLDMLVPHVVPGVPTAAIDDLAREFVARARRPAGLPVLQGLSPHGLHLGRTTWSATASPAPRR